jgi:glycine betaine/proline transport system substrate-binding protein
MSDHVTLVLGHPDSATHEAAAAAVLRVLDAHEIEAETLAAPLESLAADLAAGRIDLLATAWLPDLDGTRLSPAAADLLSGSLYRPQPVWAVTAAAAARAVPDLRDAPLPFLVAADLEPLARRVMTAYALPALRPEPLAADALFERAAAAIAADEPILLALCHPHPLLRGDALRVLSDPDGVLFGPQDARLVLRPGLRAELDPDLVDELEALTLGNPVVSAMELAMRRDGMTAADAAEAWQRGKLTPRS